MTVGEHGVLDGGDVLPGFRLPLAELFTRAEAPTPPAASDHGAEKSEDGC